MNWTRCRMNWTIVFVCFVGYISCQNGTSTSSNNTSMTSTNHGDRILLLLWLSSLFLQPLADEVPTQPSRICGNCTCGITKNENRIIGGFETEKGEYRWMAAVMYKGQSICGASLINDLYVVTVAHCTLNIPTDEMTLYLGLHNLKEEHITRNVLHALRHEKFDPNTLDHDIALLRMDERVDLYSPTGNRNSNLIPICLPKSERSYVGTEGVVTGWGRTAEGGNTTDVLMQVTLPIVKHEECVDTFDRQNLTITSTMCCAGLKEGGKDACQGDSGGPMQRINETDSTNILIGMVSWGKGCAREDQYGVFTNVTLFTSWIYNNTLDSCFCS